MTLLTCFGEAQAHAMLFTCGQWWLPYATTEIHQAWGHSHRRQAELLTITLVKLLRLMAASAFSLPSFLLWFGGGVSDYEKLMSLVNVCSIRFVFLLGLTN